MPAHGRVCHLARARLVASGLTLLVGLGAAVPSAEAARTDIVTLINGDRITGEVKELSRGLLKLRTDNVGTIDIEWDKIDGITATGEFELEMTNGQRLVGRL